MTATPMFPLESVLLPGDDVPLRIFEPRYSQLVTDRMAGDEPTFGIVLIAAGREVGGGEKRHEVGTLARIVDCQDHGAGRYFLQCRIGERIRVRQWLDDDPYPRARVEPWPDEPGEPVTAERVGDVEDGIMAMFDRLAAAGRASLPSRHELLGYVAADPVAADPDGGDGPNTLDAGRRLYALASRVPMGQADRYCVLAAPSAAQRLDALNEAVDTVAAMIEFGA